MYNYPLLLMYAAIHSLKWYIFPTSAKLVLMQAIAHLASGHDYRLQVSRNCCYQV
jgi:hypothetical protein